MSKVFFDGQIVEEEKALISVRTHALHYGTGCFEGIRAYYNQDEGALYIFRLKDHLHRLLQSCKTLFIKLPYNLDELCKLIEELVTQNFTQTDLYVRPLAFKSDLAVGNFDLTTLKDSFIIYTVPLGRYLKTDGVRANVSSWRRIPDNSIPPRAKISGAYVNTALAKTESALSGYDEALLLDGSGHIVEGSAENIFIVKGGKVITPPVSDDILEGITRDTVIKILEEDLKIKVLERSVDRSEIYSADEVFLVGTGAEISPVIEVDKREIGKGEAGEISQQVKEIYHQLVRGRYSKYPEFLNKINPS